MNKRGQALIEFVLILPILVMLLFCMIDFGKILFFRTNLESKLDDVITLYKEKRTFTEIENIIKKDDAKVTLEIINDNNKYLHFIIKKDVEVITPGLNLVLGNPYNVKVSRVVYYE